MPTTDDHVQLVDDLLRLVNSRLLDPLSILVQSDESTRALRDQVRADADMCAVTTGPVPIGGHDFGGDGTPILLLHGARANLLAWSVIGLRLARSHRVVALDLRGHGRSGDGAWRWDAVRRPVLSA